MLVVETLFLLISVQNAFGADYSQAKTLRATLFEDYDKQVRPVVNQSHPVKINMKLFLTAIGALDLKSQQLRWSGFLQMIWHDELIVWNSSSHGGMDLLTIPQSDMWLPDIFISNGVSLRNNQGSLDTLLVVNGSGLVTWEPCIVTETSCRVDIRKYPFDVQKCTFRFYPWTTTQRDIAVTNVIDTIDLTPFVPHGEFEIIATKAEVIYLKVDFSSDDIKGIQYTISLARRTTFYWLIMIFPMIAFPMLCPISFLVPVDSGEKITLSITVVLSFLVFIGSMSDAMPRLSDTTSLLLVYSSVQTTLAILTVVANGIIIAVSKLPSDFQWCHLSSENEQEVNNKNELNGHEHFHGQLENIRSLASISKLLESRCTNGAAVLTPKTDDRWILVARKLDKICFFLFMTATIFVSVLFAALAVI